MLSVSNPSPVTVNGEDLPTTEEFTYLGSTVRHDGGASSDIKNRLSKARNAFRMMNNVWKSSQYSTKTKLRLYQSCVISTLLCGSECWRMTESDLNKLSTFHTKNLRRILRIFWPETISNQDFLLAATRTAWEPSLCEDDGNGSDMSCDGSKTTSLAQPFTGHQRGDAGEDDPRSPGVGLWKQN